MLDLNGFGGNFGVVDSGRNAAGGPVILAVRFVPDGRVLCRLITLERLLLAFTC